MSWIGFSGVVMVAVWLIHRAGRDLRRQVRESQEARRRGTGGTGDGRGR